MNRITRSYTPKHKIEEVVNVLDKLVKQMTPKQQIVQNYSADQNISPIRQNQIHLKQIELQRQSIDILQQQIRDKSLENEQLKQQKQIIRQLSATGNKFIQNSRLDQSNLQDSPISRHSHQTSQTLPNFANKEQDLSLTALPSQFDLSVEQKNIQNLILQNQMLEEKNSKFKQLIQMMENKFNAKLQAYQQKEKKLEDKCRFLFSTLEGKDNEIKEIIQIQQNMLQKTIKEIEDKYRQDMLQLKQEIIKLREELQQKDLLIQEKSYEILAKEETITQLKVKYLENVKQSLAKNKTSCLNLTVVQNTEESYEIEKQDSQFNQTDQIPQFNQNSFKKIDIDQTRKSESYKQSGDLQNNQQENEQPSQYKADQINENNLDYSSDLTFKQSHPCQQLNENQFNTQSEEQVERYSNTSQSQLNKDISQCNDQCQSNNQQQEQNNFIKINQDNTAQLNQQNDWHQHKHLFEKVQKSKSQLQNIQNFLQLSKAEKSNVENQVKISLDLKQSSQKEQMNFIQNYPNVNGPLSNRSQMQNQINELKVKYSKNTSFNDNMNKSLPIINTQNQLSLKKIDSFQDVENVEQQRSNYSDNFQNLQHLKLSNSYFVEPNNKLFFNQNNNRSDILAFQNQHQNQNYNQNQIKEIPLKDLNNQSEVQNNSISELNQSKDLTKTKSKLYSLKLEQAEAWRNTYSHMYGKSPIYNDKNIKQNKLQNNF
ncbi:hypothetical protein TTHERM_00279770 (macronuclear) [Tetrahymena thermophila SB210]|uniref:Uncharacterized protein n=1 Tax=Tetrahymena thermophila (strain SB210) TaxID=312017 RepID=I7MK92_TETTS|nr:hypothetical protein TTHERM_00279770 [Tetrahymena thermophila SB210]EAR97889.2 hypothetical protein TTHERM_00279770 [Tetrahymena thermophila SB210]|eukprot:XP_001018134.2 hypothetical protein TTHERM_00279770 [Tetrahymena thermophila SB210]